MSKIKIYGYSVGYERIDIIHRAMLEFSYQRTRMEYTHSSCDCENIINAVRNAIIHLNEKAKKKGYTLKMRELSTTNEVMHIIKCILMIVGGGVENYFDREYTDISVIKEMGGIPFAVEV